jgi:hypothetical protein
MNHCECECGAHQGDFYLHDPPGCAFFPATEVSITGSLAWNSALAGAFARWQPRLRLGSV